MSKKSEGERQQLQGPARRGMVPPDQFRRMDMIFQGALAIIEKGKANGTYTPLDAPAAPKARRGPGRKVVAERVKKLAEKVGGSPEAAAPPKPRAAERYVWCEATKRAYASIKEAAEATFPLVKGVKDVQSLRTGISICLSGRSTKTGGVGYRAATREELDASRG